MVDLSKPLLPGRYEVPVNTPIFLMTPPGGEKMYLAHTDGTETASFYEEGFDWKEQGVFETIQEIQFYDEGEADEYVVFMDFGLDYLRPIWVFKLIGREVGDVTLGGYEGPEFEMPSETNWNW